MRNLQTLIVAHSVDIDLKGTLLTELSDPSCGGNVPIIAKKALAIALLRAIWKVLVSAITKDAH
jgi:hypothetical protein